MKTFKNAAKPPICAMVSAETVKENAELIKKAVHDGADAIGIQLEKLLLTERTEEKLKELFAACGALPIYVTSYRGGKSEGFTDEQCVELLLRAADCGATLTDIMGDLYCRCPYELTDDETAVKKQKELAQKLKAKGCEVLFSSHLHAYYDEETTLSIALKQQERGADIVKIVNYAQSEEELVSALKTVKRLKAALKVPFLYLANGSDCHLLRMIGPTLGVCMYLCRTAENTVEQKRVATIKYLRDEIN